MMIETIKSMCFPTMRPENISDAQTAAFISVCATQGLNPLVSGMVYAYPTKSGGIVPVIGPDGVFKKLAERKDVTYECEVFPEDVSQKPTHARASIYVEGKERPYTFTAVFSEWSVSSNPNWSSRPRHMLWTRAIKQCARQIIHGIPMDDDEVTIAGLKNVTGTADFEPDAPEVKRPAPPKRERGVTASRAESASAIRGTGPAGPIVDAETTDIPATPPVDPAPAKKPLPPLAPEIAVEKSAPAETETITSLADGQRVTVSQLEVVEFVQKAINGQPSVQAELRGGYTGNVFHIGGAGDPAWQTEKPVSATLVGKKLKNGSVITLVEKLEVSAEADGLALE